MAKVNIPRFYHAAQAANFLGLTMQEFKALGDKIKKLNRGGYTYYEIRDLRYFARKHRSQIASLLKERAEPKNPIEFLLSEEAP